MKKLLFTLFVCCALQMLSCNGLQAQNFRPSGKTPSELFTQNTDEIMMVEGDLNKDGVKDLIIAVTDYRISDDVLAFYFGDRQGEYKLFRAYETRCYSDTDITITDKGVLRFQFNNPDGFDVFLFCFQNGDFHLIGSKQDRHKSEHYDISHNYLTGKMIRVDGEGAKRTSQTLQMPPMPPLRFGWFPLRMDELDYLFEENTQVEEKTLMGIFNLMLSKGMIFPNLWYNENNLSLDSYHLAVWMEYMSFGCYNYTSDISISNNGDDTYTIVMLDEYEDRSYEQYLNEDMSNWDEVEELMGAAEATVTNSEYLFKDGKFTLIKEVKKRNTHGDEWELVPNNE